MIEIKYPRKYAVLVRSQREARRVIEFFERLGYNHIDQPLNARHYPHYVTTCVGGGWIGWDDDLCECHKDHEEIDISEIFLENYQKQDVKFKMYKVIYDPLHIPHVAKWIINNNPAMKDVSEHEMELRILNSCHHALKTMKEMLEINPEYEGVAHTGYCGYHVIVSWEDEETMVLDILVTPVFGTNKLPSMDDLNTTVSMFGFMRDIGV